jgi:energy-coupling factor transporter transmembrane protein EcfT
MYTPVAISFAASCALIGGLLVVRSKPWHALWIGTVSSACIVVGVLAFLVEIQPIAAGNNDSGEVFPFVFLPAIWIFGFAIISYTKLRKLRLHEVTPWQQ